MPEIKLRYLFKSGRTERLQDGGRLPTEFFYGLVQLRDAGFGVDMMDERDLGLGGKPSLAWTALSRASVFLTGIHAWAVFRLFLNRKRFNEAATVVVVNNAFGLACAVLHRLGLIRSQVIFLAMGLLAESTPARIRWIYGGILGSIVVAAISKGERDHISQALPAIPVHYLSFGVDMKFWGKGQSVPAKDYVLSIGNDPHRDFATLIHAWRPEYPVLKIVTSLPVDIGNATNIEIIKGDWRTNILSDEAIRSLIQESLFVVIPLHPTFQPSGQSVCLQAMACEKAVILTHIAGLWDAELMRDGQTCRLVPPGDALALGTAIQGLLHDPERLRALGRSAREVVECHLNTDMMARALARLAGLSFDAGGTR